MSTSAINTRFALQTKNSAVWRVGVTGSILAFNMAIVLSVPLSFRASFSVTPATMAVLVGCCVTCMADLTRVAAGIRSEIVSRVRRYQLLSCCTGLLLLGTQWYVLCECTLNESPRSSLLAMTGLGLVIIGASIRAAAILQLGQCFISRTGPEDATDLVTTGVYSRMRHPSEVGLMLCVVGLIVSSQVWFAFVVAVPISIVLAQARVLAEERRLAEVYADDYRQYCQRTNRWLPSIYAFEFPKQ